MVFFLEFRGFWQQPGKETENHRGRRKKEEHRNTQETRQRQRKTHRKERRQQEKIGQECPIGPKWVEIT